MFNALFIGGSLDGQSRALPNRNIHKVPVFGSLNHIFDNPNMSNRVAHSVYTQVPIECDPLLYVHESMYQFLDYFLVHDTRYDELIMSQPDRPMAIIKYDMAKFGQRELSEKIPFNQIGYFRIEDTSNTIRVIRIPIADKSHKKPAL